MARVNPTDPLQSIDIRDRTLPRTKIARVKQTLFNIGEDYEDPKVQFKYYRIMAARYGDGFVIARRQSGNLWSWGCSATSGQLGLGNTDPTTTPTLIDTSDLDFSRIFATGRRHTIALDVSGAPYTWGSNTYGQLGDGYTINRSSPSAAKGNILGRATAAGWGHSLLIDNNDQAWAWGLNNYGQLGDGTITNKSSPVSVLGIHKFRKIDAGDEFSIALDTSSKIWTWGNNQYGQLGIGNTISKSSPVSVLGNYIEVAAGSQSSYGIDTEGTIWSWGDNTYGQLGDNSTNDKSVPVSVAGRHSFIQVTGGGRISEGHACALKPDGSVWCWGRNHKGQLGLCDYIDRSSPESVIGRHSFIDVWAAKDGYNTIAIKLDGSVWVWGKDPFCDGVDYCSPVSIPDFNLITLNILGRGYLEDHSLYLEY